MLDKERMQQVFVNLIQNAAQSMPNGGTLTLSAKKEETDSSPKAWVRVEIQDTGEGMSPEVKDKIFNAFFTTKEEGKGTGLGLSLVQNIVGQHQGKITSTQIPLQSLFLQLECSWKTKTIILMPRC